MIVLVEHDGRIEGVRYNDMQRKCIRHKDSGTKPNERAQSYLMRDGTSPKGEDCPDIWLRK
jgi:hypothetical protein